MASNKIKSILLNYREKSKSCKDSGWLILFIIICIVSVVFSKFSYSYGNYLPFIKGYDSFGNICGYKDNKPIANLSLSGWDTEDQRFVFYFSPTDLSNVLRICVQECPHQIIPNSVDLLANIKNTAINWCRYDFDVVKLNEYKNNYLTRLGPCPEAPIDSSLLVRQTCISDGTAEHTIEFYQLLNSPRAIQLFFEYIYLTWHYVVILTGYAIGISIILLAMIHLLTKFVSWLIYVLALSSNSFLCALLWQVYLRFPRETHYSIKFHSFPIDDETIYYHSLKEFVINKNIIHVGAILTTVTTTILVVTPSLFWKQIRGVSLLFQEIGSHLKRSPALLIAPIVTLIVLVSFFAFSTYIMLCATTANYPAVKSMLDYPEEQNSRKKTIHELKSLERVEYVEVTVLRNLSFVYIFCFLLITEFIVAGEQFAIGTAMAFEYFRKSISSSHAIGMLFRCHLGTVAKGSFVLFILKIPRIILIHICRRLEKFEGYIFLRQCSSSLENWIGSLSQNAYPVAAMEAIGFTAAGKIAWNTLKRHGLQVEPLSNAASVIVFLGKFFVAISTCAIGVCILRQRKDLLLFSAPVVLSTIIAFYVAHTVFTLYEMISDTLILCLCEDKHICGGRFAQSNLFQFINKPIREQDHIQVVRIRSANREPFQAQA